MSNSFHHWHDWPLSCFEKLGIERLRDIRRITAISFAFKVDIGPMFRRRILLQPDPSVGVDIVHIGHCFIVVFLRRSLGCLPQQATQRGVLKLFTKVSFEMFDTVSMHAFGENGRDAFQQALLAVRKERQLSFEVGRVDKFRCCAVDNRVKGLKKPLPISVVLGVDDGKAEREELSQCVDSGGRKQDPCDT